MILTSYLYVGVLYKKNNGVSSKLSPVSIVTLWTQVVMTDCCWEQWTVVKHGPRCTPTTYVYTYTKMHGPITKITKKCIVFVGMYILL
jgi:hypothetical protein